MGLFSHLLPWPRRHRARDRRSAPALERLVRRCQFETMETRRLLAASPIDLGTVYIEEDVGSDLHGDRFEVQFKGGAAGTELTRLVINCDRGEPGLGMNDLIFDTRKGGLGADLPAEFKVEQLVTRNPNARVETHVNDGDMVLVLDLYGFCAGDKLVFSIDVDEVQYFDPATTDLQEINAGIDPITSGVEFQGTLLTATFSVPHYQDAQASALFWNHYDAALQASGLDLPEDNVDGKRDRTAAAFLSVQQVVMPAAISGYVYADNNNDGIRDANERGLAGVTVHVIPVDTLEPQQLVKCVTDANGYYAVTDLSPGTYRVVEVQQPAGYLDGLDTPGTVNGEPRGRAVNPGDSIEDIFLGGGEQGREYNFGEILPVSIAGSVHLSNADGDCYNVCQSCQPLADVTIQLFDSDGRLVAQTRTDAHGDYSFSGLIPGMYTVIETTPDGLIDAGAFAGTVDNQVRGQVLDANTITHIQLTAGDDGQDYDFCEHEPSSVSGYVYHDRNNNGLRETGEEAIADVTVTLRDQDGRQVATTQTNAQGFYQFTGLLAGSYQLAETQPASWLDGKDTVGRVDGVVRGTAATNDVFSGVQLRWGSTGVDYNFGELLPGSLQGMVFADIDRNCVFDGTDYPLAGVRLELLNDRGAVVATTYTDSAGHYLFELIVPGTYAVRETQPEGYFQGSQRAGSHGGDDSVADLISQIPIGSGERLTDYDFCEVVPGGISGLVYVDPNQNDRYDAGETVLAGVTVQLLDSAGHVVKTTTTDAAGRYQFMQLEPGVYGVHELQPSGYFHSGQQAGSHGGNDQVADFITAVTIGGGERLTEYNFSELAPAALTGYVFRDGAALQTDDGLLPENIAELRDGLRTADDQPIAGVVLELRDGQTGTPILAQQALPGAYTEGPITTVTDALGFYRFHSLPPGSYAVYELHPSGYVDYLDTPGTTTGIAFNGDSPELDAIKAQLVKDPASDAIVQISVLSGQTSQENNFSELMVGRTPPPPPPLPPPPPIEPFRYSPYVPLVPPGVPWNPTPVDQPRTIDHVPVYQASSALPMTWHLSVINGGSPRGDSPDTDPAQGRWRTVSHLNYTEWVSVAMHQGYWTLPAGMANGTSVFAFGLPGALPVSGDFNGDGVCEIGVYYEGQWFIDLNGNGRWDEDDLWAQLGTREDLPIVGDWDGDGKDDIGIFGPEWRGDDRAIAAEPGLPNPHNEFRRVQRVNGNPPKNLPPEPAEATSGRRVLKRTAAGAPREDVIDHVFRFGIGADLPVAGDWNGDGIRSIGVFRAGTWMLDLDGDGRHTHRDAVFQFGAAGDLPVVGDFNGDGIDEIGVYRRGTWYIDSNGNRELDAHDQVFQLGDAHDLPVVGDWDGDGRDDPGVYRDAG
ncbi:MAG: hypothetical protein GXY58_15155 [Planctomycetaceae bacterium]|nr:hypothetical protein [Planctomycetaceae bacterium]